jgi:hypothetical protein
MNALKHGMCAETVVLRNEIESQFYDVITGYFRDFAPVTSAEEDLITEMAVCRWRLRRTWMIETVMFELSMDRTENAIEEEYEDPDDGTRITTAWNHMADESSGYKLLTRYEARLARRYDKALMTFRLLKKDRLLENGQTNSPATAPAKRLPGLESAVPAPEHYPTNSGDPEPGTRNCQTNSAPTPLLPRKIPNELPPWTRKTAKRTCQHPYRARRPLTPHRRGPKRTPSRFPRPRPPISPKIAKGIRMTSATTPGQPSSPTIPDGSSATPLPANTSNSPKPSGATTWTELPHFGKRGTFDESAPAVSYSHAITSWIRTANRRNNQASQCRPN